MHDRMQVLLDGAKMKKLLFKTTIIFLIFSSCQLIESEKEVTVSNTVELDGLPSNYESYYLKVITWNDNYDAVNNVDLDQEFLSSEKSIVYVSSSENYSAISFFIFRKSNTRNPVYFMEYKKNDNYKYNVSYWLDYDDYFNSEILNYGISDRMIRDISIEQSYSGDFYNAPYFLYSFDNTSLKSDYKYNIQNSDASIKAVSWTSSESSTSYNTNNVEINCDVPQINFFDTQYILITPIDYSKLSSFTLSISSLSIEEKFTNKPIEFTKIFHGSDDILYGFLRNSRDFIKIDYNNFKISVIHTFVDVIKDMCQTDTNSTILIAEGSHLWKYSILSEDLEHVYSGDANIIGLYPAGDFVISNEDYGAWSTFALVDTSTYTSHDTKEWVDPSFSTVYSDSTSTLYLFRDWSSPNDIQYQVIDEVTKTLGIYDDSIYHGYYGLRHPLKIFPDETLIMESSGNVFNTDTDISYYGNLGFPYNDALFINDKIYFINDNNLISMDQSNFLDYSIILQFEPDEIGRKIYKSGSNIIIVVQNIESDCIRIIKQDINNIKPLAKNSVISNRVWRNISKSEKYKPYIIP